MKQRNPLLLVTLDSMLEELEAHRLEVILTPAPEAKHAVHFVRVVADRNPAWYRKLCARFNSSRKGKVRTAIKRRETAAAIGALKAGLPPTTSYRQRVLDAAREYYRANRSTIEERAAFAA